MIKHPNPQNLSGPLEPLSLTVVIYVRTGVCVSMYLSMCVRLCLAIRVGVGVCGGVVRVCVCVFVQARVFIQVCACVSIFLLCVACTRVCVYVCERECV